MRVDEELGTYLRVLWRYKWLIAASALIALVVALGASFLLTPRYSATATLRVASAPGGVADYIYMTALTRLRNTYVEIATSASILDKVAEHFGLEEQPDVEVEVVPETELITISASDPDPALARDIANLLASTMVEQSVELYGGSVPTAREILEQQLVQAKADLDEAVSAYDTALRNSTTQQSPAISQTMTADPELATLERLLHIRQEMYGALLQQYEERRMSEQVQANAITIFELASLPRKPTSPRIPINAALGLVAGLAMGVILAFLLEGMDDTLRGMEDVQALTSLPVLCQVPERRRRLASASDVTHLPDGRLSPLPAFDQLRARLLLAADLPNPTALLVTSAEPGAGKSMTAANLAISLAEAGHRVVLLDMDFYRPRLHSIFDLANEKGVSDYLGGEIELDAALQDTQCPNLRVVAAGSNSEEASEWLTLAKTRELLERLREDADYVLIDAPAFLSVADPAVIASKVDAVILVAARRRTRQMQLDLALRQLSELNAKVVGIVLNRIASSELYGYYSQRQARTGWMSASRAQAILARWRYGVARWVLAAVLVAALVLGGSGLLLSGRDTSAATAPTTLDTPTAVPTAMPTTVPSSLATAALPEATQVATLAPTGEPSPVACLHPEGWKAYTVREGDTLQSLATKYGVSATEIVNANCLAAGSVSVDQALYLPPLRQTPTPSLRVTDLESAGPASGPSLTILGQTPTHTPSLTTAESVTPTAEVSPSVCVPPEGWTVIHVVETGDTLWSLALTYGVTVKEIMAANCLKSNRLAAGRQTLYLPPPPRELNPTATAAE